MWYIGKALMNSGNFRYKKLKLSRATGKTADLGEINEIPKPGSSPACLWLFVLFGGVASVVVFLLLCFEMECHQ